MKKIKKFVCLVFVALLVIDICSYIRYAYEHSFKIKRFYGFFSRMPIGYVINLSVIYFAAICILYFVINFFKNND